MPDHPQSGRIIDEREDRGWFSTTHERTVEVEGPDGETYVGTGRDQDPDAATKKAFDNARQQGSC